MVFFHRNGSLDQIEKFDFQIIKRIFRLSKNDAHRKEHI